MTKDEKEEQSQSFEEFHFLPSLVALEGGLEFGRDSRERLPPQVLGQAHDHDKLFAKISRLVWTYQESPLTWLGAGLIDGELLQSHFHLGGMEETCHNAMNFCKEY